MKNNTALTTLQEVAASDDAAALCARIAEHLPKRKQVEFGGAR